MKVLLGLLLGLFFFSCPFTSMYVQNIVGSQEMAHILLEGGEAEGLVVDLGTDNYYAYWSDSLILEDSDVNLRIVQGPEPSLSVRINENLVDLFSYRIQENYQNYYFLQYQEGISTEDGLVPHYSINLSNSLGDELRIENFSMEVVLTLPQISVLDIRSREVGLDWQDGTMIEDSFFMAYSGDADFVVPELHNSVAIQLFNNGGVLSCSAISTGALRIIQESYYYSEETVPALNIGTLVASSSVNINSDRLGHFEYVETPVLDVSGHWFTGRTQTFDEIKHIPDENSGEDILNRISLGTYAEIQQLTGVPQLIEIGEFGASLPALETQKLILTQNSKNITFNGPVQVNDKMIMDWSFQGAANEGLFGIEHLQVSTLELKAENTDADLSAASFDQIVLDASSSRLTLPTVSSISGSVFDSQLILSGQPDLSALEILSSEVVYQ